MKAIYNGIEFEGTPEEMAKFKEALDGRRTYPQYFPDYGRPTIFPTYDPYRDELHYHHFPHVTC